MLLISDFDVFQHGELFHCIIIFVFIYSYLLPGNLVVELPETSWEKNYKLDFPCTTVVTKKFSFMLPSRVEIIAKNVILLDIWLL